VLLRVFFGRKLGVAGCCDLLRSQRADVVRQLAEYTEIERQVRAELGNPEDQMFALLTLDAGKQLANAWLTWIDDSLATLTASQEEWYR
jgi:hypothetical protein